MVAWTAGHDVARPASRRLGGLGVEVVLKPFDLDELVWEMRAERVRSA